MLANPALGPEHSLRSALAHPDQPEAIKTEFLGTCNRRASWYGQWVWPVEEPAWTTPLTPWEAACVVVDLAGHMAGRHPPTRKDPEQARVEARDQEWAWLLACLFRLSHRELKYGEMAP
jgi:hypothetical protein